MNRIDARGLATISIGTTIGASIFGAAGEEDPSSTSGTVLQVVFSASITGSVETDISGSVSASAVVTVFGTNANSVSNLLGTGETISAGGVGKSGVRAFYTTGCGYEGGRSA